MAIFKLHHEDQYTVVSNSMLRDPNLSLKTIGLLCKIFSLPEDWDFSEKGLAAICKDGVTAVRTALQEMEQFGYLNRFRVTDEFNRIIDWQYDFYEIPINTENQDPYLGFPSMDNPSQEKLSLENTHNKVNNNKINNNKVNNKNTAVADSLENISEQGIPLNKQQHTLSYENNVSTDIPVKNLTSIDTSKKWENIVGAINNMDIPIQVKEEVLNFYATRKGQFSVSQVKAAVQQIYSECDRDWEVARQAIHKSFVSNWKSFYKPSNDEILRIKNPIQQEPVKIMPGVYF